MSPTEQLNKFHGPVAAILREQSQLPWFLTSSTFALAQLAENGATFDEMNGATRYLEILRKMAAEKVELQKLPVKSLKVLDGGMLVDKEAKA